MTTIGIDVGGIDKVKGVWGVAGPDDLQGGPVLDAGLGKAVADFLGKVLDGIGDFLP